jgi:TRAP transporter 4TM/12TM fusion protein
MSGDANAGQAETSREELEALIAEADTGGRTPTGISAKVLWVVPLLWSLFQLYYASPLPYQVGLAVLNSSEIRSIHLGFAIFLAYLAYPALKRSPRRYIPIQDWVLALVAAFCASYLFLFYRELSDRPGLPTTFDLVVSVAGLALILEATRRALGPPLMVVCAVFMIYTFGGPYMPDVIAHKGASLAKGMSHYYLATEGVFGIALGVSASMVFLFVLFGSLLEKAGAGNYFIRVAFALMGHMKGGPAKAAVVSSGMTGLVSGSAIANVVTTGTFTIPLMRKVGFSAEKAGAVEVASSTNGQLTPPIMGAVAFLMVEYVGITYTEVIKHAALPALISYIALVYIVHLEALKADMQGLPRRAPPNFVRSLISFMSTLVGLIVLSAAVYYGLGWMKGAFGEATPWIAVALLGFAYIGLVQYATRFPELETDLEIRELPEPGPTIKAGLYYLLPVLLLVWCLTVERLSPGLAAFYASIFMLIVLLTQRALKAALRRGPDRRGAEHDRHRRRHGGRRHRGRDHHADRGRLGNGRVRRVHLRRPGPRHADLHRRSQPDPGHGAADDRQLHRGLVPDGACHRYRGRAERADRAADRRAHVRLLFRHPRRRHPARGLGRLRGGGHIGGRPHQDGHPGLHLRHPHGDPAVPLHLQHRTADDRGGDLVSPARDDHHRGHRHAALRRGNPGLFPGQEPALGVACPDPHRLHHVPARVLDGLHPSAPGIGPGRQHLRDRRGHVRGCPDPDSGQG